jgi:hypothetical protein
MSYATEIIDELQQYREIGLTFAVIYRSPTNGHDSGTLVNHA